MKSLLFTLMLFACSCAATAQGQAKIAFLSMSQALHAMPAYTTAMQTVQTTRQQYDDEMAQAADEFNDKYQLFLDQQATLDPVIRAKRQADLEALLERNTAFRDNAKQLLRAAEADAIAPLKEQLRRTIATIAAAAGYIAVLNTDADATPYLDPAATVDIQQQVEAALAK